MSGGTLSVAKRRLVELLKRLSASTSAELAAETALTEVAIRQHLHALEEAGLVTHQTEPPRGRGRPSKIWSLTALAQELFPDRHADLTLDLIESARETFGQEGLDRLVAHRAETQTESYRETLGRVGKTLGAKVRALARRRTAEGYMAETVRESDGSYLLVEQHCPICDAAKVCTGLCSAEQQVFEDALGKDLQVERIEHLLSGGSRCVYRIRKP